MKKIILIPLLLTLLNADLAMPDSTYIKHTVSITNAEEFSAMAVIYCSPLGMGGSIGCTKLKNNATLSKYKFASGTYLFTLKNSIYEKYNNIGFFTRPHYEKERYALIKDLGNPLGTSSGSYVSNKELKSTDVDTHSRFKITKIKDGYMHFELLK